MEEKIPLFETVVNLTKRRGFIYPSSEIYGGFNGVYDYGPMGVLLSNNIKNHWWKMMVQKRPDIVGLDSGIFMSPKIWVASGHVSGFSDPLMEHKKTFNRIRADHILEEVGVIADEKMSMGTINELLQENKEALKKNGYDISEYTEAKRFNLLVTSNLGDFTEDGSESVYLRGETCQGIYVNYKNVLDTTNQKIPFGIAQIGKAFRNEIAPRQYIFRKREFEQMEMQMFTAPEDEMKLYEVWKAKRWQYYLDLGFKEENLRWHEHENLVFYAKAAFDIEYKFPFGFKELEGIHARGNYDLTQHQKFSGVSLEYLDPYTNERYLPHVVETSVGLDRTFLAILSEFYDEDELGGETRVVLRLPKALAPIKVAVFPLLKNRPELVAKAETVFALLSAEMRAEFDDNGNVGKRYRRQDEIGTPYCVTIDFETLGEEKPELKDTVTVRDRDSGEQTRVAIADLVEYLNKA